MRRFITRRRRCAPCIQGTPLTSAELELVGHLWASPPAPRPSMTSIAAASAESNARMPQLHRHPALATGLSFEVTRSYVI